MNTRAERAQILAALRAAKLRLSHTYICGPNEQFICHALHEAYTDGIITRDARILTEEMIQGRLGRHYIAEEWIEATVGVDAFKNAPRDAMQQWRHRWIDSMIEEFSDN